MLIDTNLVQKAKEKLGDKTADIIANLLSVEKWDEKNKKGLCPFHLENTPSFIYNPKKLNFKCFGCNKTVDIIDTYMYTGKTYIEAVKQLFDETNTNYSFGEQGIRTNQQYTYPREETNTNKSRVYKYLGARKISKETIDYADVREDDKGNCVFNYYDTNDVLTMVKYRPSHKIDKQKGENKCWCQTGSDTKPLLFNMNRINTTRPLLITEGEIDCLAVIEAGWSNAVSVPFGSQNFGWIEENYEWLEQFNEIIICADNDEAGVKMRKECVPRLGSWRTKYIDIPKTVQDPNDIERQIPVKDMNEVLYYLGKSAVIELINNASDPGVPSVIDVSEVTDLDIEEMDGIETGIKELDTEMMKLFYGTLTVVSGLPGCVDKDTEFFNGKCWKKISDYEEGDQVLQYNKDGTAELVKPEAYIVRPCDKFYYLKNKRGVDQMFSEEHNVVFLDENQNLKTLPMKAVYDIHNEQPHGFDGRFITTFNYRGTKIDLSDDEIRLMCAVIADGSFYDVSSNARTYKKCKMNLKKQRKQDRLESLLQRCDLWYEKQKRKDGAYTYFFYAPIRTKVFPVEWYNFSRHQMEVFADEVLHWDGTITDKLKHFYTTNKADADFVQFIFACLGYKATISVDDRVGKKHCYGKYTYKKISYLIKICTAGSRLITIYSKTNKPNIEIIKGDNLYKYCFTVPSHMWVMRRNNKICITGNSGKTSFLSQIACQSLEQDKSVMMFSREMPSWMQKSWLNYIMAGPHNIKEYEDKNGAKFYKVTPEAKAEISKAYNKKWFLYRDDWSNKIDDILVSMEDCVKKYGVKLIILDNLMTIDLGTNENNELLKQTDCITKLIKFALKYSIAIILVAHPRKIPKDTDVGIYDISGTANIANLAHRTLGLKRIDKEAENSNYDVMLTVIKDRMRGRAGKKIYMYYDIPTRRFYTNVDEYQFQYKWDTKQHQDAQYPHNDETEVYGEVERGMAI